MSVEREFVIETFRAYGEASRSEVRARPLAGQGVSTRLRVHCSKEMRHSQVVGTRFVLMLKMMDRGGGPYLHAHHNATFRLATEGEIQRLLGPRYDDVAALSGVTQAVEGETKLTWTTRYERDESLRRAVIEIHGTECMACRFSFEAAYGQLGEGFIEVHHLKPISESGMVAVDARTDLVVLCSNCHSMIHRRKGRPLSLTELRGVLSGGDART